MKSLIAIALCLVSAQAALASRTVCSDAAGYVTYTHQGYNRGMPPQNGDEIGRIQIRANGKLVSESIAYQGLNPKLGALDPNFTDIKVLKDDHGGSGFTKDFSALLTLTKSGTNLAQVKGITLPYARFVICNETFIAVP